MKTLTVLLVVACSVRVSLAQQPAPGGAVPPPPAAPVAVPPAAESLPPPPTNRAGFFTLPGGATNISRPVRTAIPGVPPATSTVARPMTNVVATNRPATNAAAAAAAGAVPGGIEPGTTVIVPPATPPVLPVPPPVPGTPGAVATPPPAFPPGTTLPGVRPPLPVGPTNVVPRGFTNEIPANTIRFQEADLSQILEYYAYLTRRTVLKSPQVPATVKITLRNETPLSLSEGIDALNTILGLNGVTMVDAGEKFVKAVPSAVAGTEAPPFSYGAVEDLPDSKKIVAQIVQLKNIAPEDVTQVIQPFASLPNSIIALRGSPIVILRDYAENVKRMVEVVEKVDIAMPLDIEPVVIPIRYALAGDVANVLSGLTAGGSTVTFGSGSAAGGTLGSPAGSFGAGGFQSGAAAGRFGTTGAGYNTGAGGIGGTMPGGARQLGTTTTGVGGGGAFGTSRTAFGGRLNQAVQGALNRAGGAGAAAGDILLIGQAKIIADERSNALLVFAERRDLPTITNIISKLDVVLPQVLIEALIMEVNLGDGKTLGVSMKQNHQELGDLDVAGGSVNGPGFLNPRSITGVSSITALATNLPSGFSYFGKLNEDFDFAITAAANDSRINVLSRPRVQTSTAKPASIFVGETRPYVTGTYFSDFAGSGSRSQYSQMQIGISLNVLPIINQDGLVTMEIAQDISQVGGTVRVDNNDVPITINRTANAYVAVNDRDTIILGGFISTTKSKSSSGVPYLKDIPGLGMLFRSSSDNINRVELIVLIRPTVLPTPEAAALQAATERDRLPSVRRAEREEEDFAQKQLERARREEEAAEKRRRQK